MGSEAGVCSGGSMISASPCCWWETKGAASPFRDSSADVFGGTLLARGCAWRAIAQSACVADSGGVGRGARQAMPMLRLSGHPSAMARWLRCPEIRARPASCSDRKRSVRRSCRRITISSAIRILPLADERLPDSGMNPVTCNLSAIPYGSADCRPLVRKQGASSRAAQRPGTPP